MKNIIRKLKAQHVIFIFIAFILPWMFVPILSQKSYSEYGSVQLFGWYVMILPATGIIMGQILIRKKVEHIRQWIYLLAFFIFTILIFLWGCGKIGDETLGDIMGILLVVFSIALFLSCCLGDEKETPAYHGKTTLFAIGVFTLIELLVMFFPDFTPNLFPKVFYRYMMTLIQSTIGSSIMLYGEEYAWRGHLMEKLQRVFGKRMGVIVLGLVWEFWHAPYFMIFVQSGLFSETLGFSLGILIILRIMNAVSLAIIMGWAYTKTENLWSCVLIHGINNGVTGSAAGSPVMDTVPFITLMRPVILSLFLFTKEYKKNNNKN